MASSKQSQASSHGLTGHGVEIAVALMVMMLIWRSTGGSPIITAMAGLIIMGLALMHYSTIISQVEGI